MRRLLISICILLLLGGAAGWHVLHLSSLIRQTSGLVEQAASAMSAEDWEGAQQLTRQALQLWEGHEKYLHNTLRHTDVDGVLLSFHTLLAHLKSRQLSGPGLACAAQLLTQLSLILEGELPTWSNLL